MQKLSAEQAGARMRELPGWTLDGDWIRRQFTFESYPDAIGFVVRLAFAAEAADHHPDVEIRYKRVTLSFSTHSAGGLTEKDFAGAREADALAGAR